MATKTFRTDLNCESCVATVTPFLKADPAIESWSVDTDDSRKVLTVSGEGIDADQIRARVKQAGFNVYEELAADEGRVKAAGDKSFTTYYPLFLILVYLLGFVAINSYVTGDASPKMLMNHFMGGFFVVFSFFKMLNLKGFAESYRAYDIVAKKIGVYATIYPFLELGLGTAYLAQWNLFYTNWITAMVMAVSSVGVLQSVLKKEKIRCACLGTVFNLPMSTVTLVEDFLMLAMALIAIVVK